MGVLEPGFDPSVETTGLRPLVRTQPFSPLLGQNLPVIHVFHTPTTSTSFFQS
jgi:hypothetical protein